MRLLRFLLLLLVCNSATADTLTVSHVSFKDGSFWVNDHKQQSVDLLHDLPMEVHATYIDGTSASFPSGNMNTFNFRKIRRLKILQQFRVDTSLRNKIIIVDYLVNTGSLTMLCNGQKVVSSAANTRGLFLLYRMTSASAPLLFNDSVVNIELDYSAEVHGEAVNFYLKVYSKEEGEKRAVAHTRLNEVFKVKRYCVAIYYLSFAITVFALFLFFRRNRENLYFAISCFLIFVSEIPLELNNWQLALDSSLRAFALLFFNAFLLQLFEKRPYKKINIFISIVAITCIVLYWITSLNINFDLSYRKAMLGTSIVGSVGALIGEILLCLLILAQGLKQRKWEAKTIVYVCLSTLVLTLLLPFVLSMLLKKTRYDDLLFMMPGLGLYIYPLSMALVIGRRHGVDQNELIQQLASIQSLSEENLRKEKEKQKILAEQNLVLEQKVTERTHEVTQQKNELEIKNEAILRANEQLSEINLVIERERKRSDDLLLNILPYEVAEELKANGAAKAQHFNNVTVLFTDFVNFTSTSSLMTAQELIDELHACFKVFDVICSKYGIEKIKTIGDAYLAVSGLPSADAGHAQKMVLAAIEIRDFMVQRKFEIGDKTFGIRIGMHSGDVVAGIVGIKKFAYDIWGDAVNTAARMEQNGIPGKINVSDTTYELIKNDFECEYRGEVAAKGKGMLKMYLLKA